MLLERVDAITADTVAIFPFSGAETLDPEFCNRVGHLLVQLLAFAVRDGRLEPRGGFVADLHRMVLERGLPMERLFTFAYLTERTALDELAVDDTLGATSEPWPLVAQLVRRASFDLLGAYTERAQLEPSGAAITDRLTTLYTRPMFQAVLAKELERAGRFGYDVSLILFDVDRLSADQQGTRLRRRRQDSRAARHHAAHLLPAARLGRAVFGGFDRGAADAHRSGQRGRARRSASARPWKSGSSSRITATIGRSRSR